MLAISGLCRPTLFEDLDRGVLLSVGRIYNIVACDFGRTWSHVLSTSLPSAHETLGSI